MRTVYVVYLSNRKRFPCLHSLIETREGVGRIRNPRRSKITTSKKLERRKQKIHFTDQNVSSYNINLTMAFLN